MECKYCSHTMRDLTHGKGSGRNYLCDNCGGHARHKALSFWKDEYEPELTWMTKEEWDKWLDEM